VENIVPAAVEHPDDRDCLVAVFDRDDLATVVPKCLGEVVGPPADRESLAAGGDIIVAGIPRAVASRPSPAYTRSRLSARLRWDVAAPTRDVGARSLQTRRHRS
jgi:hypothetical protein